MDPRAKEKILPLPKLVESLREQQGLGKKIVFTNGCFDLLHVGHTRYLADARRAGDLLVIGINSDESIIRLKGPKRPIVPLDERMEMLANFWFVDYVAPFSEDTPLALIEQLQPDILVKGGDWPVEQIVGREIVQAKGGEVFNIPLIPGRATSNLIEEILKRYQHADQSKTL